MTEKELLELEAIDEKKSIIRDLLLNVDDIFITKFFDLDSDKLLDEKIDVLTKLSKGVPPEDIENYYKILELYPKDNEIWD